MKIDYEKIDHCILCESLNCTVFDTNLYLYRCDNCGHIFDNPRPTLGSISQYYSEKGKYEPWIDHHEGLQKQWLGLLQRILRFKQSGNLLDVGAGIGQFLHVAQSSFAVSGTEISSEGVSIAKERFGITLEQGEIESIDFAGKQFDVIVMHQVLEHVPFPGKTIDYCKSLLKPGGVFYISVPNEAPYSLRMLLPGLLSVTGKKKYRSFSLNGHRKIDYTAMEEIHLSHFSEPVLRNILKSKGFNIIESNIDFIDPLMFSKGSVQCMRHAIYYGTKIINALFKINMYNCFWITARKQ